MLIPRESDTVQLRRAGGSPASTKPSSALCGPPSGSQIRPVAGLQCVGGSLASTTPSAALCSALGPAGFDNNIFCTLRAAVRQPASAGCRAVARWEFAGSDNTMFCHLRAAVRQSASAG
jgi:hypothetical protein